MASRRQPSGLSLRGSRTLGDCGSRTLARDGDGASRRVAPSLTRATFRLVQRNLHVLLVRPGLHGGTRRLFIITRVDFVGEEKRGGGITTERFRGAKSKVTKESQAAGRFVVGKKNRSGKRDW